MAPSTHKRQPSSCEQQAPAFHLLSNKGDWVELSQFKWSRAGIISRFACSVYMYVVLNIGHQAPALKKELFLYDCFGICLFVFFLINPQ